MRDVSSRRVHENGSSGHCRYPLRTFESRVSDINETSVGHDTTGGTLVNTLVGDRHNFMTEVAQAKPREILDIVGCKLAQPTSWHFIRLPGSAAASFGTTSAWLPAFDVERYCILVY